MEDAVLKMLNITHYYLMGNGWGEHCIMPVASSFAALFFFWGGGGLWWFGLVSYKVRVRGSKKFF